MCTAITEIEREAELELQKSESESERERCKDKSPVSVDCVAQPRTINTTSATRKPS